MNFITSRLTILNALFFSLLGVFFSIPITKAGIEIFATIAILIAFYWSFRTAIQTRSLAFINLSENKIFIIYFFLFFVMNFFSTNVFGSFSAFISKFSEGFLIMLIGRHVTRYHPAPQKLFYRVFLVLIVLILGDAVFQWVTGVDFLRNRVLHRGENITGSFFNPNDFAGWLVIFVLPFFGYLTSRSKKKMMQWLALLSLFFLMVVILWMTSSRGAVVGIMGGLMTFFFLMKVPIRSPRFFSWGSFVVTVLFFIGLVFYLSTLDIQGIRAHQDITGGRGYFWQEAFFIFKDHPLFGAGLNTYLALLPEYSIFPDVEKMYPHNCFLQLLAENGAVGLTAFLGLIFYLQRRVLEAWNTAKDPLLVGSFCGLISFLIHSFFDTNLYSMPLMILFWLSYGVILGYAEKQIANQRMS